MTINKNYIIIALIVISTVLVWMNINKESLQSEVDYEAQIDALEAKIDEQATFAEQQEAYTDSLELANKALSGRYDSLSNVEQEVKHIYHETYVHIPGASNAKLDSIIRSNW